MKYIALNVRALFLCTALFLLGAQVQARDIGGVVLQEQVMLNGIEQSLLLNGAGIRYKFFFKIYVGALYLPELNNDPALIMQASQANRIAMHIVYDEVPQEKLTKAWLEGFEDNTGQTEFVALKSRLDEFNAMFTSLQAGDVVLLDYLPGIGTRVSIKGEDKGLIEGADFNRALLSVWLGDDPVTEELKQAMLGIAD